MFKKVMLTCQTSYCIHYVHNTKQHMFHSLFFSVLYIERIEEVKDLIYKLTMQLLSYRCYKETTHLVLLTWPLV